MNKRLIRTAIAAVLCPSIAQASQVAFDNTTAGTAALGGGPTNMGTAGIRKAVVFTTPALGPGVTLTDLRIAARETNSIAPESVTLIMDLRAVNASNQPTGSSLANFTTTFTVGTTNSYYTFDLAANAGSTFDDFVLAAGTTYALVLQSQSDAGGTWSWIAPTGTPVPTAANGFTFVGYQLSTNSEASWSNSTLRNAIENGFETISAYKVWETANAPGSNPQDDTDGDGVPNAVEFVLGGTSLTKDLSKMPVLTTSGANMTFTFQRAVSSIDPKTAVFIETSTDLVTWNIAPSPYTVPDTAVANVPGVTVVKDTSLGFDTVTLTVPQAPDTKKFARLRVVITP